MLVERLMVCVLIALASAGCAPRVAPMVVDPEMALIESDGRIGVILMIVGEGVRHDARTEIVVIQPGMHNHPVRFVDVVDGRPTRFDAVIGFSAQPGHHYRARGRAASAKTWVWIEDAADGRVVGGESPGHGAFRRNVPARQAGEVAGWPGAAE